jgi:hypothetical protein
MNVNGREFFPRITLKGADTQSFILFRHAYGSKRVEDPVFARGYGGQAAALRLYHSLLIRVHPRDPRKKIATISGFGHHVKKYRVR